jgi:hypothetical protein
MDIFGEDPSFYQTTLTDADIISYCEEQDPDLKENIICRAVQGTVALFPGSKHIYALDLRNNLFVPITKWNKDNLRTLLISFVGKAVHRFMREPTYSTFSMMYQKDMKALTSGACFAGARLGSYEEKIALRVPVDCDRHGIHFINGRLDLPTFQFQPRPFPFTSGLFITKAIGYEFTTSDDEGTTLLMRWMHGLMSQIIIEPESLEYFRGEIAKAVSCTPIGENTSSLLYIVGKARCGKTTILNLLVAGFTEVYCKIIDTNSFRSSRDALATLNAAVEPQTRFLFIDNPPPGVFTSNILKSLSDAIIAGKMMYSQGQYTVAAQPKLIISGNHSISIGEREGNNSAMRQMMYYQCKNRFHHLTFGNPITGNNPSSPTVANNSSSSAASAIQGSGNVRVATDIDFKKFTALDRTAILLYFCQHCRQGVESPAPPMYFRNGAFARNIRSFLDEMLVCSDGSLLNIEDIMAMIEEYIPSSEYNRKEVIFALEKYTESLNVRYLKDKQVSSKKGFFLNLAMNEDNFVRLRNGEVILNMDGSVSETFSM